ncbi:POTRA domain-containing protein [Cupriavidus basilensis]|uniref:POTRA domain-containing protein n=1 Tax=Cupriavidus basilensis TaxID=68895 RepID=UPI001ED8F6CC|nr:POTRA domain-containing protein [Cupriavidus basilensis]
MHEKNKNDASARWRALCLAVLGLGAQGTAMAQAPAATEAATPGVQADAERRVDINEYIVRGNTVLDARAIERAVTPFLGPKRTMKDIEGARDALLAAYQAKGFQSVYVDLPEQQAVGGVVFLQVSETKVGRVRVVGAQYNSPVEVREQVPALAEGAVPLQRRRGLQGQRRGDAPGQRRRHGAAQVRADHAGLFGLRADGARHLWPEPVAGRRHAQLPRLR